MSMICATGAARFAPHQRLATLLLGLSGAGWAATADSVTLVEPVIVLGQGAEQRAFDTPYSASVVGAASLRTSGPMVNLSEALVRVPGLVANNRHNFAQDLQISSRGFGARASFGVRGLRLLTDGFPASGPDGQGQVSHFELAGAARIEVLRGPFSALYGSSSGGVIALVSQAPLERQLELAADADSTGLRQTRVSVSAPWGEGWSMRAGVTAIETDGLRPHASARRLLANARLERSTASDRWLFVLNALDMPAEDPLGLTRAQFSANPEQTALQATQFNTRKNTRQAQLGLQWTHRFNGSTALQRSQFTLYGGQRAVTQWQSIPVATQAPTRHPGGVIDLDRHYGGLDARWHWRWGPWRLVSGAALDLQQENRRGFENFTGTGAAQMLGVTGQLRRDEENTTQARDLYAQAELDIGSQLMASGGLRQARLSARSVDQYLSNGNDSGKLHFGATLPVLGLRWQPQDHLSVHASVGRGFEAPTLNELAYRSDGSAGFNTALKSQRSSQWELGLKWRHPQLNATLDVAVFEARTKDEVAVQSNLGGRASFHNVGRTRRRGLEASATWRLDARWRTTWVLTVLDTRYRDGFLTCPFAPCGTPASPAVPVPAGHRMAGTLPKNAFVELVYRLDPLELGLEARGQGRQPVNDANSDFAAGHGLLGLRALHSLRLGSGTLESLLRVDNLADRRVVGSVIVNEGNQRFFEPAAGRTVLLSLRWRQRF